MREIYFVIFGVLSLTLIYGKAQAFSTPNSSRIVKAQQDIRAIGAAVELYKNDTGRYPTNFEGLAILLSSPEGHKRSEGYLARLPLDPWGNEYQYKYPGTHNVEEFDLWTLGADGKQGGDGVNGDFGNWPGSFDNILGQIRRKDMLLSILGIVMYGSLAGFCVGLPVYLVGFFLQMRAGYSIKVAFRGFHLGVLIYLMLFIPVLGTVLTLITAR